MNMEAQMTDFKDWLIFIAGRKMDFKPYLSARSPIFAEVTPYYGILLSHPYDHDSFSPLDWSIAQAMAHGL